MATAMLLVCGSGISFIGSSYAQSRLILYLRYGDDWELGWYSKGAKVSVFPDFTPKLTLFKKIITLPFLSNKIIKNYYFITFYNTFIIYKF